MRTAAPTNVTVWVAPNVNHTGALRAQPAQWAQRVTRFIDAALLPAPGDHGPRAEGVPASLTGSFSWSRQHSETLCCAEQVDEAMPPHDDGNHPTDHDRYADSSNVWVGRSGAETNALRCVRLPALHSWLHQTSDYLVPSRLWPDPRAGRSTRRRDRPNPGASRQGECESDELDPWPDASGAQ
jgi:hypothetical protein